MPLVDQETVCGPCVTPVAAQLIVKEIDSADAEFHTKFGWLNVRPVTTAIELVQSTSDVKG